MKLVTNNFRYSSAKHFVDSVSESNTSTYYVFAGRSQPFANDNNVPTLYDNSRDTVYDVYDNMLFGKRLSTSDVSLMINRYNWTANTVYARYDDEDDLLSTKQYFVVNSNNAVFKCLNNNNDANSTVEPVIEDPTDESYITADGYQWKYMYSATAATVTKFATQEYFPFVENSSVVSNAVSGAIEIIDVVTPGERRYIGTHEGTFQDIEVGGNTLIYTLSANASATNDIYTGGVLYIVDGANGGNQRKIVDYDGVTKRVLLESAFSNTSNTSTTYNIVPNVVIAGNGLGAQARAVVNSSTKTIESVLVTSRGAGYDYATVEVEGTVSSNTPAAPVLRAILPPSGGHGKNQAEELGAHWVGISSTLSSSSSGGKIVDKNDFRILGLLKNPQYRSVTLTIAPEHEVADFSVGQEVTQSNTNATGTITDIDTSNNTITVTDVTGLFEVGSSGTVGQLVITYPGSGYFANTTVTIAGNTGSGATANAQANATGRISNLNITANGSGYLTVPDVTIAAPTFTFNANTDVNPVTVKTFNALTGVSNTGNYIAIASNPFVVGDIVTYTVSAGNTTVTGLTNTENYYVVYANSTTLALATTAGGANVDLTAGSSEEGHTLTNKSRNDDYITVSSNKFQVGDKLLYVANTGNTAVGNMTSGGYYYVRFSNTTAIKLSNSTGYPVILAVGNTTQTGHNLIGETATAIAVITSEGVNVIRNAGNTVSVVANAVSGQDTYFDQTLRLVVTNKNNSVYFVDDETVIQPGRTGVDAANGLFYASTSSANAATSVTVRLTHTRGTFNSSGDSTEYLIRGTDAPEGTQPEANIQSQTLPDLVYGSGEVIYIESVPPITKNSNQTETFKFIFEF